MSVSMSNKNCGWCGITEGAVHYHQSNFSMSSVLEQSSGYNDFLNRQIQAITIKNNDRLLSLSNMKATSQECHPENRSETSNT